MTQTESSKPCIILPQNQNASFFCAPNQGQFVCNVGDGAISECKLGKLKQFIYCFNIIEQKSKSKILLINH